MAFIFHFIYGMSTSDEFGGFLLQNDTKKIESNSLWR